MTRNLSLIILACLVLMALPENTEAQYDQQIDYGVHPAEYERIGQSGWQFLKLPTNARNAAMGGVITSIGRGNAGSALTNPASIADVKNIQLTANLTNWFADINYNIASVVKNFGNWGTFGINYIYVDYGEMIRTEYRDIIVNDVNTGRSEILDNLGTFSAHDFALGLSYARQVTDQLQVGGNIRYIEEKIDNARIANWSIDIGTLYYTGLKTLRVAMVGKNFGPDVQFASWDERIQQTPADVRMPMVFSLGVAYDILEEDELSNHLWTVAIEFLHPNDGPEKLNFGSEYVFKDLLALRGGYRFNYDEEGLTLGAGIDVEMHSLKIKVDYAYWNFGVLGNINLFTLGIGF
jgi:hypothetical protein